MDNTTALLLAAAAAGIGLTMMGELDTTSNSTDPVPESFADPNESGGTTGAVNRPTYESIVRGGVV